MTLAPGTLLGPYEIETLLGVGGMGEVYRARDSRLGRTVAIKILPEAVSGSPERRDRFDREARAVASLSHPHICALFDIGDEGNIHFLVLEHLPGTTLAQRLDTGPLPAREALRVAFQVASALAAAHGEGVIHRDLKPANIMLTPNGAKVLDFGLAKSLTPDSPADLTDSPTVMNTQAHTVLGTAAYMSPEQARGEPLDGRSDIWSLGVVLYEMLTGRRFLEGDTLAELHAALLQSNPDRLSLPDGIPHPMRSLLPRLLERDPAKRLARMEEVAEQLERALGDSGSGAGSSAGPVADTRSSILVLPFTNLSSDPDNEYFSDGLTEEVIADLSKVRALRVISRTTAMRLKGTQPDLRDLAAEFDVRYALEGSVRKAGNSVRITTQLIDTRSDETLWSEKYGGTLEDVFQIQEDVSRAIVKSLQVTLTPEEDEELALSPRSNGYAYDVYLRTRRDIEGFTSEGLDRARKELESALQITGDDVLLYKGLGMTYWQYVNAGLTPDAGHLDKAEEYARRILAMEPGSPHGTSLLGLVAAQRGDIVAWLRNFERAYAADPNDPVHGIWLGLGWAFSGIPDRARPVLETQLAVDPHSPYILFGLGILEFNEGRYEEALPYFEKAGRLLPEHSGWIMVIAQTRASQGNGTALREVIETAGPPESHPLTRLGHLLHHAWLGDEAAFDELDTPEYRDGIWGDLQYTWVQAQAYAILGRKEDALRWLTRSVERGHVNHPYLSSRDPLLANLRGDPRFEELMARVKDRYEHLEAEVFANSDGPKTA